MSNKEKAEALRHPAYRAKVEGIDHPAGQVDEQELKDIAGAGDTNPETTPACVTATITVSAALCPTTKCTSKC
ncbi:class II lanthipeptide, LchA2/BrtA2 family [Hazenella sp. IB182357]|uniref:Class II lanthipeptide, LchA2/BrtA2 family n=1 Tax=Polycladospora coralii TaxID=2771432 RepID=A0A926NEI4_9BACL|nr:class II lanthipeptide, LchA2/BrtA2 family [Polycladospora coralii]MBD1372084.1 class II lanthipeptide, LchA2/BrtA2 family [Polycladospora coralii]MBS7530590.1 class II lanthipeptide, LchA2/BrtA2 family [Polycladospora coralii]